MGHHLLRGPFASGYAPALLVTLIVASGCAADESDDSASSTDDALRGCTASTDCPRGYDCESAGGVAVCKRPRCTTDGECAAPLVCRRDATGVRVSRCEPAAPTPGESARLAWTR